MDGEQHHQPLTRFSKVQCPSIDPGRCSVYCVYVSTTRPDVLSATHTARPSSSEDEQSSSRYLPDTARDERRMKPSNFLSEYVQPR